LWSWYCPQVRNTPTPYWILLLRLIDDESVSYRVGQDTSPILAPTEMAWAMI
jgi:hypothetical protein